MGAPFIFLNILNYWQQNSINTIKVVMSSAACSANNVSTVITRLSQGQQPAESSYIKIIDLTPNKAAPGGPCSAST